MKNILTAFLFFSLSTVFAQNEVHKSYVLYTYHIAKYVDWENQGDIFKVVVLGSSPVTTMMAMSYKNKKLKNSVIQVYQVNSLEEIDNCHILFLPKGQKQYLEDVKKKFSAKPVLLITEFENAAKQGASINFVIDQDNAVKFELNRKVIKQSGLKLNNSILALAILIN